MADTTFRTVLPDLKAVDNGDGTYSVAVSVENLPYDPQSILRIGFYQQSYIARAAVEPLIADQLYAIPFVATRDLSVDRIAIEVTIGDAGKVARIGIYETGTNLYPGALVVDGGEVSVAGVALVAATIAESLTKGLYWIAITSDGVATLRGENVDAMATPLGNSNATLYYTGRMWRIARAYAALPDPFTAAGAVQTTESFRAAVRVSSLD